MGRAAQGHGRPMKGRSRHRSERPRWVSQEDDICRIRDRHECRVIDLKMDQSAQSSLRLLAAL